MSVEQVISEIAQLQYGLTEIGQLIAAGINRHHVEHRLKKGRLRRVRSGVFVVAGAPHSFEQDVLAAVLAAGSDAVASHTTAAVLWGLPLVEHEVLDVTTSRRHWAGMPAVRAHRTVAFIGCEHTASISRIRSPRSRSRLMGGIPPQPQRVRRRPEPGK
jgi:predicted transcriptional regulator of viral defense system